MPKVDAPNFHKLPPRKTVPHLIIQARAGTGKTTTLIQGLRYIRGLSVSIHPSPQQSAIWESLLLSKDARSVTFCAFSAEIAKKLADNVPPGCEAKTIHSLGFGSVRKAFQIREVVGWHTQNLLAKYLQIDKAYKKENAVFVNAVCDLVKYAKNDVRLSLTEQQARDYVSWYTMDVTNLDFATVVDTANAVLTLSLDPANDQGNIDYNDMLWLPLVHNLPVFKRDLLLVDESQDMNPAQQQLALRAGHRLVLCGDELQAIFGFAGADIESIKTMRNTLQASPRGCEVLPLTETRRCSKAVVRYVNRLCPDLTAHKDNLEGDVIMGKLTTKNYHDTVEAGDMVLCRCTAPLVSECFKFLKQNRLARVRGRKIGESLIDLAEKLTAPTMSEFQNNVTAWMLHEADLENQRKNPSETRLESISDRGGCLLEFSYQCKTPSEITDKINSIFTDSETKNGIDLATLHKAKGLEAQNVFILQFKTARVPHPRMSQPWQVEQEDNLQYVGETRAINNLYYCEEPRN